VVPNPFRSLSDRLSGRSSSEAEEPTTPTGSEPTDSDETGDSAIAAEHDADSEGHGSAEEVDSGEHDGPEETDTGEQDGPEATDTSERPVLEEIDASDTPAPSIGPHTKITQEDPETRLARHEQSNVDAMGQEKRREVVGGSYSPSFARQAALYGIFVLVVGLLVVGAILAVNEFDQPPEEQKLEAPWKDSTDPAKAAEIDFPEDSAPEQVPTGPDATGKGRADRA